MVNFVTQPNKNGVYVLSESETCQDFEQNYLQVRKAEGRILEDETVLSLPSLSEEHPLYREWAIRKESSQRFLDYFDKLSCCSLLDLGCGNGWFSRLAAKHCQVTGLDINFAELTQAARLFGADHIRFCYGDVFENIFPPASFNCIALNGVAQYFPDFPLLMGRLNQLLKAGGEMHILDSPFYHENLAQEANQRSVDYYQSLGFPEMANYYYHRRWSDLAGWDYDLLYDPVGGSQAPSVHTATGVSPFPWIRVKKV